MHHGRSAERSSNGSTPTFLDLAKRFGHLYLRTTPRIVRCASAARVAAIDDEGRGAFRVGSGEQLAQGTSLRNTEQSGLIRSHVVEHGPDIVHALLERRQTLLGNPIRKTSTPLIKEDQSSEACKP
jgi:hypothetical protein